MRQLDWNSIGRRGAVVNPRAYMMPFAPNGLRDSPTELLQIGEGRNSPSAYLKAFPRVDRLSRLAGIVSTTHPQCITDQRTTLQRHDCSDILGECNAV